MGASFFLNAATVMQLVIIEYEVYKLTGDPLSIGLIGLAQVVPYIGLALIGGHFADKWSKKRVIQISLTGIMLSTLAMHLAGKWADWARGCTGLSVDHLWFGIFDRCLPRILQSCRTGHESLCRTKGGL